ncbi:MAG TPA: IS1595 family transposase [Candidatus Saccharimonadales bacterium]|nr:IS1595 family transposase [Candidatus Saccharimonadales bacterium]
MDSKFSLSQFSKLFPDEASCLEEIKKQRFPKGIHCKSCRKMTRHYRVTGRTAYSCKSCRRHVYPLSGTLFEKSSTPLRIWLFAMFLMIHSRDGIPTKQLQQELGVTYKTAWRMRKSIRMLMEQDDADLLRETVTMEEIEYREHKWVFFNKFEFKLVQKQEPVPDDEEE